MQPYAIAVATAALPGGPVVRAVAGLAARSQRVGDGVSSESSSSGAMKNSSGDISVSADKARANPHPREVTRHANERLQTRDKNVTYESMEAAAVSGHRTLNHATGITKHDLPASQSPTGRGVTVVTNPKGSVVTVMDKGTKFMNKKK